jgi:hypothetical protein
MAESWGDGAPERQRRRRVHCELSALPGVVRSFVGFSEAAQEANVSRIYNGAATP